VQARTIYWCVVAGVVLVGALLRAPAIDGVLYADDWDHYAMQEGIYPVALPIWDKFNFVPNADAAREALQLTGRLPWWTAQNIHLAVFRPVSSLLVHFDFAVLDAAHHPGRLHVHSLLWWLLLIGAVAALFGRVLPLPVAALAVLLYTVDDAHAVPVTWAANRSELVSVALVMWGLWAHIAARATRSARLTVLSLLLVTAGLLAGEHSLAPLAYFVTFELCASDGPFRYRVRRLLPIALLAAAYLMLRAGLGYGVAGSALYIDPIAESARYLSAAALRMPLLLGDLVFGAAPEWWFWAPGWTHSAFVRHFVPSSWVTLQHLRDEQFVLCLVALGLSVASIAWLYRRPAGGPRRTLRWLMLGALLSLIPLSGTAAMTRLTVAPAIAYDAGLAYLLWRAIEQLWTGRRPQWRLLSGLFAAVLLQLHVVRAAMLSYETARNLTAESQIEYDWVRHASFDLDELAGRHVFVVCAFDMATQFGLPYVLHLAGLSMPLSSGMLSPAFQNAHVLTRPAPNVLEIEYPGGPTGSPFKRTAYRPDDSEFHSGERIRTRLFDVLIKAVHDGEPTQLRFSFPLSLDDPRYVFMYPTRDGLKRVSLPVVGGRTRLSAPAYPR
jgi:hypothetical protein